MKCVELHCGGYMKEHEYGDHRCSFRLVEGELIHKNDCPAEWQGAENFAEQARQRDEEARRKEAEFHGFLDKFYGLAPNQCIHCGAVKITETQEGHGVYNHILECPAFTDH